MTGVQTCALPICSIQLLGNADAIVFGRGTSTFIKDEEIGFGWGSGWYMQDASYLRVRNNKSVYSTGDARFAIMYDTDNTGYYVDPGSVSVFNDVRLNGGNVQLVSNNVGRNTKWRSLESSTDVGISFYNAANTWCMQLYADNGVNYGFLNGNWAGWDLRKSVNGQLILTVSSSEYTALHTGNYSSYALPLAGGTVTEIGRAHV